MPTPVETEQGPLFCGRMFARRCIVRKIGGADVSWIVGEGRRVSMRPESDTVSDLALNRAPGAGHKNGDGAADRAAPSTRWRPVPSATSAAAVAFQA